VTSTTLTPEQRRLRGRIGAFALHASGGTSTKAGTAAFLERFEREAQEAAVARGETLTPDELASRARSGRKAYFARLALASSRARSKRKAPPAIGTPGEAMEVRRAADERPPAA
jgi:hypothetical protein